ncbi:hypothetical protein BaRGS_00001074 [Batillaria attramentaria]|uniref:Uncharacterized protein n=1 Tax=Batillaria attramentaria TaxID=370345 RepID=A0ABD0M5B6_9CAEN
MTPPVSISLKPHHSGGRGFGLSRMSSNRPSGDFRSNKKWESPTYVHRFRRKKRNVTEETFTAPFPARTVSRHDTMNIYVATNEIDTHFYHLLSHFLRVFCLYSQSKEKKSSIASNGDMVYHDVIKELRLSVTSQLRASFPRSYPSSRCLCSTEYATPPPPTNLTKPARSCFIHSILD